jgi:hypothetical protein
VARSATETVGNTAPTVGGCGSGGAITSSTASCCASLRGEKAMLCVRRARLVRSDSGLRGKEALDIMAPGGLPLEDRLDMPREAGCDGSATARVLARSCEIASPAGTHETTHKETHCVPKRFFWRPTTT